MDEIANGFESPVAILTGGMDPHYALGLASALAAGNMQIDLVAGDEVAKIDFKSHSSIRFVFIRRQGGSVNKLTKVWRVIIYYCRLIYYVAATRSPILHILWNNQIQWIDRTVLMLYYRVVRKAGVLTAHNVNAAKRDQRDSVLNRLSLKVQYRLAQQIFVHTDAMMAELMAEFGIPKNRITVIPYGWNNVVPNTGLSRIEARHAFGLSDLHKTLLIFGYITPYKGIEYLVTDLSQPVQTDETYRLIIAGQPKRTSRYWQRIESLVRSLNLADYIIKHIRYIPEEHVEKYFKAADAVVLPYTCIYQSGILLIAYPFGVPVLASMVSSFPTIYAREKQDYCFVLAIQRILRMRLSDTSELPTCVGKRIGARLPLLVFSDTPGKT